MDQSSEPYSTGTDHFSAEYDEANREWYHKLISAARGGDRKAGRDLLSSALGAVLFEDLFKPVHGPLYVWLVDFLNACLHSPTSRVEQLAAPRGRGWKMAKSQPAALRDLRLLVHQRVSDYMRRHNVGSELACNGVHDDLRRAGIVNPNTRDRRPLSVSVIRKLYHEVRKELAGVRPRGATRKPTHRAKRNSRLTRRHD